MNDESIQGTIAAEEPQPRPPTSLPGAGRPLLRIAVVAGWLLAGYAAGRLAHVGLLPYQILYAAYALVLVAAATYDLRERRVPNVLTYQAILFAFGAIWAAPGQWWRSLLGAALFGFVMLVPVLIYGPDRAGMGDVKLALFMGLVLRFPEGLLSAGLVAFVAAAIVGLVGILLRKLTFKSTLPFGPFMALGGCLALLGMAVFPETNQASPQALALVCLVCTIGPVDAIID